MSSFQATLVNAGYGQLALRDQLGKLLQKWTLAHPKCVIGTGANCNVRCLLPGIADQHVLMVVGAKQIFMRALAPGLRRDGTPIHELILTSEHSQFAFDVAGHRFEYTRQSHPTPIAKATIQDRPANSNTVAAKPTPAANDRLRFTFVRALEKNRDRQSALSASDPEANVSANFDRPVWVEEIVRDALKPVESRLNNIIGPIQKLEREMRRERARKRKSSQARKVSRQAAHDIGHPHAQNLLDSQETIQKIVIDQSARLDVVNKHVADIVSQLAALERIVSVESDQYQAVASRTTQSGQEIIRLQHEMLSLVNALQHQAAAPAPSNEDSTQWRSSIEKQLAELHHSLSVLDDIKSCLQTAVAQSRELTHDFEARWQRIEEVARQSIVLHAPPAAPVDQWPQLPALDQRIPELDARGPISTADVVQAPTFYTGVDPNSEVDTSADVSEILYRPAAAADPLSMLVDESAIDELSVAQDTAASATDASVLPEWWTQDPVADQVEINPHSSPDSWQSAYDQQVHDEQIVDGHPLGVPDLYSSDYRSAAAPGEEFARHVTDYEQESALSESHDSESFEGEALVPFGHDYYQSGVDKVEADASEADAGETASTSPAYQADDYASRHDASPYEPSEENASQDDFAMSAFSAEMLSIEPDLADDPSTPDHFASYDEIADAAPIHRGLSYEQPSDQQADYQQADYQQADYRVSDYGQAEFTQADDQPGEYETAASEETGFQSDAYLLMGQQPVADEVDTYAPMEHGDSDSRASLAIDLPAFDAMEEDALESRIGDLSAIALPSTEEGGDESVEDYMRRLLARMRGVSESEVKLPGLEPTTQRQSTPALQATVSAASTPTAQYSDESLSQSWTEPFDPDKYIPRVAAPEKNRDINALRELANTSARSAIQTSARRRHSTAILIKSSVALVGLVAGVALISINGTRVNIALIATIASFLVAVIWGYDAMSTLRPLLQASRHSKIVKADVNLAEPDQKSTQPS